MSKSSMDTEYSVYIHHLQNRDIDGQNFWEMKHRTANMNEALREASSLYETNEYQKVEVKKKIFDSKRDRKIDITFKVFDGKSQKPLSFWFSAIFAACCGIIAFSTVYALMH